MAKTNATKAGAILVKLVSTAATGYFYVKVRAAARRPPPRRRAPRSTCPPAPLTFTVRYAGAGAGAGDTSLPRRGESHPGDCIARFLEKGDGRGSGSFTPLQRLRVRDGARRDIRKLLTIGGNLHDATRG